MGPRSLAKLSILAVVFLVTSAFGQTVTFTWPQCSSVPSGFSGVCQNADLSMTFVWASTQTFPPPILPLPLAGSGAAFTTGPTTAPNGTLAWFVGGTGQVGPSGILSGTVVTTINSLALPESRITNLTSDLASKQAALPNKAQIIIAATLIPANSCTSAATVSVVGTTTASVINFTPAADITAVNGWGTAGGLVIASWPTQDTVNYRVCNQSNAAITPSASVMFNVGSR